MGRPDVVLRLSEKEREMLKILIAALKVSEYTDDVDGGMRYGREEKMRTAMQEMFSTLTGYAHIAGNVPPKVMSALTEKGAAVTDLEPVLAHAFEVGRRYKRFNPDKMRSEYGKLVMLLQDAVCSRLYPFKELVRPVQTVGGALKQLGALDLLHDDRLEMATTPLPPRPPPDAATQKDQALKDLVATYGKGDPAREELVERCLRSLDDAETFVQMNLRPIRKLKIWLAEFKSLEDEHSLAIRSGKGGACLSHSHRQQIGYVMEALTLWEEVHKNIFAFWETVEDDMVTDCRGYRYRDTGQGFHRVCGGSSTYGLMMAAISRAHEKMGGWVGSKVVHLGDNDVPNPLVFIDKYTIIPRLLSPIVQCIESLDAAFSDDEPYPGFRKLLLGNCTSPEQLKRGVLADFFRHGFDGSGDDGGSCIDGRLTSAWNWCSLLHKKKFYPLFLLTGFNGFDANYN